MKRRHFVAGSLAIPAAALMGQGSTFAQQAMFAPVANRTFIPDEFGGAENTMLRAGTHHIAYEDLGTLEVWWANWWAAPTGQFRGRAETTMGADMTAVATLTYYHALTGAPVTVKMVDPITGSPALYALDGSYIRAVPAAPLSIVAGAGFHLEIRARTPAGMAFCQRRGDFNNGDFFEFGREVGQLGAPPAYGLRNSTGWYGPSLIIGPTTRRTVAIVGDSIRAGLQDTPSDGWGAIGVSARAVRHLAATVNVAIPGDTAHDFALPGQSARRRELMAFASDAIIGYGTNDVVYQGLPAADTLTAIDSIAADFGKPVIFETVTPATIGDLVTPARGPEREEQRRQLNGILRGRDRVYDSGGALEATEGPGGWLSPEVVVRSLGDEPTFTHPTNVGGELAASVFDPALLGDPSPVVLQPWDLANLGEAVLQWLHPDDYADGVWPARVGPAAEQQDVAAQPERGPDGGAVFTAGKWLSSRLPARSNDEYIAATIKISAQRIQTMLGADRNGGRQFRLEADGGLSLLRSQVAGKGSTAQIEAPVQQWSVVSVRNGGGDQVSFSVDARPASGSLNPGDYAENAMTTYGQSVGVEPLDGEQAEIVVVRASALTPAAELRLVARLAWRLGFAERLDPSNPFRTAEPTQ